MGDRWSDNRPWCRLMSWTPQAPCSASELEPNLLRHWVWRREHEHCIALFRHKKICSDFVTVCSSFYAEMSPVTFNHLKNFQNISLPLSPQTTCRKWPVIHPPWSPVWTPPAQSPVSMYPQCHHYHHLWCTHKHTHLWRCEVFYTLGKRVNIAVCGNIVVSLPLET